MTKSPNRVLVTATSALVWLLLPSCAAISGLDTYSNCQWCADGAAQGLAVRTENDAGSDDSPNTGLSDSSPDAPGSQTDVSSPETGTIDAAADSSSRDARDEGSVDEAMADGPPGMPVQGLVGYWKFDDASGNTALDSSGHGNTGVLVHGPQWASGCKVGGCLSFSDQSPFPHVEVARSASLDSITGPVTIGAWMYLVGSGYTEALVSRRMGTMVDYDYCLNITQGDLVYAGPLGTSVKVPEPSNLSNRWRHVAATYDGSLVTVYIDGAAIGSGSIQYAVTNDANELLIGALASNSSLYSSFNGKIDEVVLYNRALSPAEIAILAH